MLRSVNARYVASLALAFAGLLASAESKAQEPDLGGEDVLILSSVICGQIYADRPHMSECLAQQNAKADRWMAAIVDSYARYATEAMADLAHGGVPFDQVGQLQKAQSAFEAYRNEASILASRTGLYGMTVSLDEAIARFDLTVERARFLLHTCHSSLSRELTDKVDLTIVDWCPPGL